MTKQQLREQYETETGKSHGNPLFSTTDYACWLETKLKELEDVYSFSDKRNKALTELEAKKVNAINLIFDNPPSPKLPGFIEAENDKGHSINVGEWTQRPDKTWCLRIERGGE